MNKDKTQHSVPCRGCTTNCAYFSACNGRLWRLTDSEKMKCLENHANKSLDKSLE